MSDSFPKLDGIELEQLRQALRIVALRRLGDVDAAEDATQETLLRVFAAMRDSRLEDPAKFYGFVWAVANNVVQDVGRRARRIARLEPAARRMAPDSSEDPLAGLVSAEDARRVRAALDRLDAPDRELLRLCYYDGLSPAEVAARLGEPGPRLRKRKSRALERLRAAFLPAGPAPPPATPEPIVEAERRRVTAKASSAGD